MDNLEINIRCALGIPGSGNHVIDLQERMADSQSSRPRCMDCGFDTCRCDDYYERGREDE
jgi:hypothetical protein